MRARLIAIFILILGIGGPGYLYWFFYKENISAIIFVSEAKEPFTVSLEGKISYESFPLLDEVFRYKSTCSSSCIFSPVPPLDYQLTISTTGREDITDVIKLSTGEQKKYQVDLPLVLFTEKVSEMPETVPKSSLDGYRSIGVTALGKIIAVEEKRDGGEVGTIQNGKFISLFRTQTSLFRATVDGSKSYLIVPETASKQLLYPLDGTTAGIVFPYPEKIMLISVHNNQWKVQTENNLYEKIQGSWKLNPRFTDFIDLNQRYRLGYIRKNQAEKLRLQNLPTDQSLIVLLDRISNEVVILKRGIEIVGFFMYNNAPAYLDFDGNIIRVDLKGSLEE